MTALNPFAYTVANQLNVLGLGFPFVSAVNTIHCPVVIPETLINPKFVPVIVAVTLGSVANVGLKVIVLLYWLRLLSCVSVEPYCIFVVDGPGGPAGPV